MSERLISGAEYHRRNERQVDLFGRFSKQIERRGVLVRPSLTQVLFASGFDQTVHWRMEGRYLGFDQDDCQLLVRACDPVSDFQIEISVPSMDKFVVLNGPSPFRTKLLSVEDAQFGYSVLGKTKWFNGLRRIRQRTRA